MILKKFIKITIILILFSGLLAGKGFAQEKNSGLILRKPDICGEIIFDETAGKYPITLEDALSIVLGNNFDVKIFTERKNRDKWRYYNNLSDWLPDIDYEYTLSRIQGTFLVGGVVPVQVIETPIQSNFIFGLNVNAQKYFDTKEAFYELNSQKNELEFTKDEALLEAARSYYELLRAKLNIKIRETNIEQIEEQLRINRQKVEAGVGTKFDVLRAEADLSRAEQELIVAKNRYRLKQAQLANTLGLPVLIQLVPVNKDVFIKEIFADCFTLEHAKMIALTNRADLKAQQFDVEAARQRKNAGYTSYIPELNIFGQLANQGTARAGFFPSRLIGFTVAWRGLNNLGLEGYTEAKSRKAELREEQFKYINKTRNIENDLVDTYFNTIAARDLIRSTDKELNSATESRRLSVIRLEAGIGTFIDVLQSQNTYTNARINHLRSIIGYNISQVELLFEMGVISVNNILCGYCSGADKCNPNIEKAREYNKKIRKEFEKARQYELERQKKQRKTR